MSGIPSDVDAINPDSPTEGGGTLICFSHLRWNFVYQRPQHLMSRFARDRKVIVWEEPIHDAPSATLDTHVCDCSGVTILTPHLPAGLSRHEETETLRALLDGAITRDPARPLICWYYTPMMLPFSDHLAADCIVYDCMDELANFKGAPSELLPLEQRLLDSCDLVFTGGHSLYEAKAARHPSVHAFPSSVDATHFSTARAAGPEPEDQAELPSPRLGFYGVVDERMDLALLEGLADARPEWSIVIVGPVVKISDADLPRRPNLHYLGGKGYAELPDYLRGWDVALMPFAINEATRFISPTKTPEYLAAGCPVVSTPVRDVVRGYGDVEAVRIADGRDAFVAACDAALTLSRTNGWLAAVDARLAGESWDLTQCAMSNLIDEAVQRSSHVYPVVSPIGADGDRPQSYDVMVVGAGFAGAIMAERLARDAGKRVLVVDKRPHVAGNAYDRLDDAGILIHQYGPHIFHTNSADIFEYLSQFTEWRGYEHRVLAAVGDRLVPMPINRTTVNSLYHLDLRTEEGVE